MEREVRALNLALLLVFALMADQLEPASAQVFCRSQFNLANEACSMRTLPGVRPLVPRRHNKLNETSVTGRLHYSRGGAGGDDYDGDGEEGGEHQEEGGRGQHGRRRHRRRVDDMEDPYDTACCRRLMALDNSCVCQAAARLPAFMTAVRHVVRLTPVDGCHVTFECPGSF
ncbi:hypothetical protein ABZP36_024452 [Zizania latifolia]